MKDTSSNISALQARLDTAKALLDNTRKDTAKRWAVNALRLLLVLLGFAAAAAAVYGAFVLLLPIIYNAPSMTPIERIPLLMLTVGLGIAAVAGLIAAGFGLAYACKQRWIKPLDLKRGYGKHLYSAINDIMKKLNSQNEKPATTQLVNKLLDTLEILAKGEMRDLKALQWEKVAHANLGDEHPSKYYQGKYLENSASNEARLFNAQQAHYKQYLAVCAAWRENEGKDSSKLGGVWIDTLAVLTQLINSASGAREDVTYIHCAEGMRNFSEKMEFLNTRLGKYQINIIDDTLVSKAPTAEPPHPAVPPTAGSKWQSDTYSVPPVTPTKSE